ncbi:MAG TPA: 2-isopropylmalate synthase [Clostridiales bacterium]|nr:2-isopropylmalate synthase [Clostridiales bacterium]
MPRRIEIFDTTLRDGEQSPGCSMNIEEKIEVAKQLERLKVDVMEAGFAIASPGDFASVKAVAETVRDCRVASLSRAVEKDIDAAFEALKGAVAPRIHTFIATSPIHMQHKLRMTPEQVLERTALMVAYAKKHISDVEFSAEDATRSDWDFLARVFGTAIQNGATVINVPDTVGYTTPQEMYELISYLYKHTPGIEKALVSVHCHNDLGMGVANSLAAVKAGAGQVECTINGIGERAGNAALEEIVMSLVTRQKYFDARSGVDTSMIYRTSRLVQNITGMLVPANKAVVGANAFAHEAGIHQHGVLAERSTYEIMTPESVGIPKNKMVLGKHSGRHAFEDYLKNAGYQLSDAQITDIFEKFKVLADKKKYVLDRDIDALVGNREVSETDRYQLISYVINSGNALTATANVKVARDGVPVEKVSIGDGPVDAAFKAINLVAELSITLDDYSLHSVTEGEDALGEAMVKLTCNGQNVVGRGLSTDVIEASIKAYINGVNKILLYATEARADEKKN